MGIGHAATRDFLSFLKYATKDDDGNENPLAMADGERVSFSGNSAPAISPPSIPGDARKAAAHNATSYASASMRMSRTVSSSTA